MSPVTLFKRVLAMDREELRFRASSTLRREAAHLAFLARRPAWDRRALADALRHDDPAIGPIVQCLKKDAWADAHALLMRHVATREPRFVIHPSAREARRAGILEAFPTSAVDALRRGDQVIAGRFDLLGYRGLSFSSSTGADSRIDWQLDPVHERRGESVFWSRVRYLEPSSGDHKIIWELNRHQHWMTLGRAYWLSGDRRYRACFADHLAGWMPANPPLVGMNWASMLELALRGISWLWALHLFASPDAEDARSDTSPWTLDLLLGLDRQLTLVEQNLSRYFSPNTHLLGEALALYAAGRALPELRRAGAWERLGRSVLLEQIPKQIRADGGHAELSTHYHRYTLDFYLLALAIALQTGDPCTPALAGAVDRLARFARTIADDTGRLPAFGDEDGGSLLPLCGRDPSDVSDSLQLAAHLLDEPDLAIGSPAEEVVWMTGEVPRAARTAKRWRSAALLETGYFVSRSARGDHVTIDAGPHGFLNGGHAHADALSLTLSVRGRPLLVDPGTGCYTIDPDIRDRFRSSQLHNTLTLDDRSQSVPDGPFHWRSTAHARSLDWRTDDRFDYFEGSHDGYAPSVHHRTVLSRPGCWFVVDRVRGAGSHQADVHWHLDPGWSAAGSGRRAVRVVHPDGTVVWIVSVQDECEIVRGTNDGSGLGWCAPAYGQLVPTSTVRMRRCAKAPFSLVTVIVESPDPPAVESLAVAGPGGVAGDAIGFTVRTSRWTETAIFARTADEQGGGIWTGGGLTTDARVVCWRGTSVEPGEAVVLIDGGAARNASAVQAPTREREEPARTASSQPAG